MNVGKVSVAPVSPELTALTGQKIKVSDRPDALRDEALEFFPCQGGVWDSGTVLH